ncbi:MAG: peroxiredoxin family protein [archaeon]|nr:peroxiredoxin family protein [archaeon]
MTIEIGDVAPDFTVMSTDRESFNLYTELEKGPILLNFYIGDFGINCMNYMIKFIESANKIIDLGVTMVPINSDSLDSHKLWKKRIDAPFEFLFDEDKKVSKQYGAIVGPGYMVSGFTNREFFLIGRDKKVKFIWKATTPKSIPTFDEILEGIKKAI